MSELQQNLFDSATSDLCALVAEKEVLDLKSAMHVVYESKLYRKLQNPETGLYREGPVYLYDMLLEERGMSRENIDAMSGRK